MGVELVLPCGCGVGSALCGGEVGFWSAVALIWFLRVAVSCVLPCGFDLVLPCAVSWFCRVAVIWLLPCGL